MRAAAAAFAMLGAARAMELTAENWDDHTSGKTVFIKFLAPWWGHCKSMKPAWDKLIKEYEGSETILIADVDCTAAGKSKCEDVGVQGYPTIKYGDADDLSDYQGGRDLAALKAFAAGLGPMCSVKNIHLCDDEKKAKIEEFKAMDFEVRKKQISAMEADILEAESDFESFVEGLQKSYEASSKKKDEDIAAIKDSGLGLLKAVHAFEGKAKTEL